MKKMEKIKLEIDGIEVGAKKEMTLLQVAHQAGIDIPTLCNDEKLAPYGGCRLCLVEMTRNDRTRLVASCIYPAEEGLIVKTDTERIRKIRRMILELILPLSPTGPVLALAERYGLKDSRFTAEQTNCILCGLCVRYCDEVKKSKAIGFIGRGIDREVAFLPDVSSQVCLNCRECFNICPGGKVAMDTDGVRFPIPAWDS